MVKSYSLGANAAQFVRDRQMEVPTKHGSSQLPGIQLLVMSFRFFIGLWPVAPFALSVMLSATPAGIRPLEQGLNVRRPVVAAREGAIDRDPFLTPRDQGFGGVA